MSEPTLKDTQRDVLLQEYLRVCADIRALESYNDKIVAIGFAVLSIGVTVGIAQKIPEIFFILPLALIGVMAYAVMSARWVVQLGAYKAHLEDQLNDILNQKVLIWEKIVLGKLHGNASYVLLWFVYLTTALGIFYISVTTIFDSFGSFLGHGMGFLLTFLMVLFFVGIGQFIKTPSSMRKAIAAALEE